MQGAPEQIPVFDVRVEQEELDAVEEVLRSGWLSMGPRTEAVEEEFAESLGARHAVALSSCTGALHLACVAAGLGPGDEVLVPSMSFVATVNAVRYVGATPVFVDIVSEDDLGIDVDQAMAKVTERTKAIIPVHYAGYAVEIERLVEAACERGLLVIEDAAHAPSARERPDGPKLGTLGLAGCYSFFPNKVLGIGEGGALVTGSDEFAARVRRLRSHGMTASAMDRMRGRRTAYDVRERGFNYRFDDVHAAILGARLGRLEEELVKRRAVVERYREQLRDLEGVSVPYADFDADLSSVYLMGVVAEGDDQQRFLRRRLSETHGIQTTMYPAIHRFEAYRAAYGEIELPRTERVVAGLFSIPLFPHMEPGQQERVVEALRESLDALANGAPA